MNLRPSLPGFESDPPQTPHPQRHHRPETFIEPRHTAKTDIRAPGISECGVESLFCAFGLSWRRWLKFTSLSLAA
jgi:hypothetical protein